jgi:spore maturation protein CgeB/glycosyltransferase involved in cell wall biosynthesis/SAM-dependent methyltransferase
MSVDILDRVYDAYAGELGQQFMRDTQRRIHWMCEAARGTSVLDVGCSQGLIPILLGREGKTVVGIDSSAHAIRDAEQRLTSEPLSVRKRVAFIEGDFTNHAFDGLKFDCLIMGEVLEHLLRPERFLEVAARMLAVGERLVVTVPFGINDHFDHKHTFYLAEPYRLLSEHFDIVDVTLLGKWLGLVGVRRADDTTRTHTGWSHDQIAALEAAFQRIERELVDDVTALRIKLDDANAKYRSSTEEAARLKREISHHEHERKLAEKQRQQLQLETPKGDKEDVPPSSLEQERGLRHERELLLARLEERLEHAGQIRKLELKDRDAELVRVNAVRAELQATLQEHQLRLRHQEEQALRVTEQQRAEVAHLLAQQDELTRRADTAEQATARVERMLDAQTSAHRTETARLYEALEATQRQNVELANALQRAQDSAGALEADLKATREGLELSENSRQKLIAEQSVLELKAERSSQRAHDTARERDATLQENAQYQRALGQQKRDFERTLEDQRALQRAAEAKAEQLKSELETSRRNERRASVQLDAERRERATAERRAVQTKNTLSFQLGYELIHGFKSKSALVALPKNLWQLQQEALRRRREKHAKHQVPLRPIAKSGEQPVGAAKPTVPPTSANQANQALKAQRDGEAAPKPPLELSQLRVACVHDEFTFKSFAPECNLLQLTPSNWQDELEAFQPQLLFIESAWRGKNELWSRKIAHCGQELLGIVEWCRNKRVPTAFWNKEDPVHYRTFLNTAKLFDFVFTTDIDCVARYKRALGHDRVHLLPFAVQPKAHNPIEKYERKDAIAFAGAYYARYPERQADLASFVENFGYAPRLEIFDRNHGKSDPDYQFPERYREHIVGTLAFEEIDKAYKGYRYALNLNSIKASQSMFARRVFELLASNTVTVSNFSRGVRLMFGDLVVTTDRGERALAQLQQLANDPSHSRRLRLAGLRKVLSEHTYAQRLHFIAAKVWDQALPSDLPRVTVLARVTNARDLDNVLASYTRQNYEQKRLLIVGPRALDLSQVVVPGRIDCLTLEAAQRLNLGEVAADATHVATIASLDHYGKNYLLDLALATRYSPAKVIGKSARFRQASPGQVTLLNDGAQYRTTKTIPIRAALARRDALPNLNLAVWLETLEERAFDEASGFAIDEFNYCENGAELGPERASSIDDLELDSGLPIERFLRAAAGPVDVQTSSGLHQPQVDVARLSSLFKPGAGKPIALMLEGEHLVVQSSLADETHEYLYAREAWAPAVLGLPESGKLHFEATPGLNIQLAVLFLDAKKQRLGHKLCQPGANEIIKLPVGATQVQLALRIYGAGSAKVSAVLLDHVRDTPDVLLGRGDYLLITNRYPSDQDLYRNGFVHRRVLEYRRHGAKVDVFRVGSSDKLAYYEFDGVDVISGGIAALEALLRSNRYKAILVHFLEPRTWQALLPKLGQTPVLIWAHGAEIQAWHRREAHYGTQAALEAAKADSEPRNDFWRGVIQDLPTGSKLIFVSRQFATEVLGDLGVQLPADLYEIIHNVIDTRLFEYRPKSAEQRLKVLSIRPYTSRIYGNDLAVSAILALAERPYFDQLDFHLVGDGPLFDETVAPLRGLANVRIDRRFLSQREIAELHKHYGVFLCPSRGDTQGVSRDEAMSSGLVPITNSAGAIPEFVDHECGILAEREDALGLAAGIALLYEDPALFLELSLRAAQRVRRQSGPDQTTAREMSLIVGAVRE